MDELLRWANMGALRQFALEVEARLQSQGNYAVRANDDSMVVMETYKTGAILGIGGEEHERVVFAAREEEGKTIIDEGQTDTEFVAMLAGLLEGH